MKVIANDHDIIIEGQNKIATLSAEGDYSEAMGRRAKKRALKYISKHSEDGDDSNGDEVIGRRARKRALKYISKHSAEGDYSEAIGDGRLKNLVGSGKVQGALGKAQGVLGVLGGGVPQNELPSSAPVEEPKKMSTGVKIAIGVGAVIVIGVLVYMSTKKKK